MERVQLATRSKTRAHETHALCLCWVQAAKREAGRLEKECQQIMCIVSTLKNHVTDVEHQIDEAVREVSSVSYRAGLIAASTVFLFVCCKPDNATLCFRRPKWRGLCCKVSSVLS